ncbi:large conductance mechanosensitive channel protein MscL [Corynebacterium sp. 3HC-13]|uniref:large conductance mechanosensitive channel protein MscL n=1 Tax=Corynebacterium poyangense TaxID=2684405 RepID=UPI001CCC6EAF|nr:large conductance mechanosensitive channel protein MscL [Corynebacterium poyangense]MBZ8176289.1 large conductance mechanosensitive channel protein MscL [Corynebacterium poyangense]
MLQGFKEFILRGNVVELAVAFVIGSAFTAIITAFTKNLIDPLIATIGGADVPGFGFQIVAANPNTFMNFGAVITAILNFLIIAAVVYFVLIVPMNKLSEIQKRRRGIEEKKEEDSASLETHLLEEIRDLLKARQQNN